VATFDELERWGAGTSWRSDRPRGLDWTPVTAPFRGAGASPGPGRGSPSPCRGAKRAGPPAWPVVVEGRRLLAVAVALSLPGRSLELGLAWPW